MFNLQGSEIIVIMLLALVVLGPEKLPDAVRRFSQTYSELKKMGSGFQSELKSALDEPMREMRETAKLVRDAADPSKIASEAEAERRLNDEVPNSPSPAATDPVAPDPPATDPEVAGPPLEGVSDTGSDLVATPGQAPDDQRTRDDRVISDGSIEAAANDESDEAAKQ